MQVSELEGKSVIPAEGENIGTVEDTRLRSDEQRLGTPAVKSPRFAAPQVLLAQDISRLGGDVVPTASAEKLQDQARSGESAQMVSPGEASGNKVATASGNCAGMFSDVHIDPVTGKIRGYWPSKSRPCDA